MAFMIDYGDDWRRGYIDLCRRVADTGEVRNSRVGITMEIRDYVFTLSGAAYDMPYGTGRNMHVPLGAAEAIQLCAGLEMPDLTEAVSSKIAAFVRDADGTVHGNYGGRIGWQITDVVNKLKASYDTRQAVIQIWDKELDSEHRVPMPKDIPCTLSATFSLDKNDCVTMSVVMRSNDVWLGVPYDVFQFRQLQRTIANLLKRGIGQYTHHAISMHAYDRNLGEIRGLEYDSQWSDEGMRFPNGLIPGRGENLRAVAHDILKGDDINTFSHSWYFNHLGEAYASIVG